VRTVLFHRDFKGFGGGHLKVWHYYNHVRRHPGHIARILFSRQSVWDESNPWCACRNEVDESRSSVQADLLFLAGRDWLTLGSDERERSPIPIINLVQAVQHARPDDARYPFLKHRAIRICVSQEVAAAISETGRVNGPVFVIPNGIDLEELPRPVEVSEKDCDVLIVALKQPDLGGRLMASLKGPGWQIELLTANLPRAEFLKQIARARVTVFLPKPAEGFYLPALEGMALGTIVVCPDCVGNRSFCRPGYNCLRPEYAFESIAVAIKTALELSPAEARQIMDRAGQTAAVHDLMREREAFLRVLENVDNLWINC
jgi:glycosyltransferase involved in cell wall biosynthesis